MKIAVDLDEILGGFVDGFCHHYNKKMSTHFKSKDFFCYDFWKVLGISEKETFEECYEFFMSDAFRDLPTVPGAKEGIAELKKTNELYVVSGRPLFLQEITERWVEKNFPNTFKDILITNTYSKSINDKKVTKSEFCQAIGTDVLIDDHLRFANECAGKGIRVVLLDYPWNQQVDSNNITRVYSWPEIVATIEEIKFAEV